MGMELAHAYPALKREWQPWGRVKRLDSVRGVPDFLLTCNLHRHVAVFAEVKAELHFTRLDMLSLNQAAQLDEFHSMGLLARVVVKLPDRWLVFDPPFLDLNLRQTFQRADSARTSQTLDPYVLLGGSNV